MWFQSIIIVLFVSVRVFSQVDDESRPYKFKFNIDGYQHRSEEKDDKGIIKGEYGFITADGYYRVTVYATDENGDFRIISMKNIYVGFPPEDPTTTPASVPAVRSRINANKSPSSSVTSTNAPAIIESTTKRTSFLTAGRVGCSSCIIPTTSTAKPPSSFGTSAPLEIVHSGTTKRSLSYNSKLSSTTSLPLITSPKTSKVDNKIKTELQTQKEGLKNFSKPEVTELRRKSVGVTEKIGIKTSDVPNQKSILSVTEGNKGSVNTTPRSATRGSRFSNENTKVPNQTSPLSVTEVNKEITNTTPRSATRGSQFSNEKTEVPKSQSKSRIGEIKEGLPEGVTMDNIKELLYRFNYTVGFHGHHEDGYKNGDKLGDYFFDGRDGTERKVEYIANEFGYQPNITLIKLDANDVRVPKEETEKGYGLKGYEFKWFYRR